MRRVVLFFAIIAAAVLLGYCGQFAGMALNLRQITALAVFTAFIAGTLLYPERRLAVAFAGIALLLSLGLLSVRQFIESANLNVIVFLIGMFLTIGFLEEKQFFEHLVHAAIARTRGSPGRLLIVLMLCATVSAALVDEVTSILFMTAAVLHITDRLKLKPIPWIIMTVFATNIGSAASSIGNPIGVMISFNAGFTFTEFLRWAAPIALAANLLTCAIGRWWFAADYHAFAAALGREGADAFTRAETPHDSLANLRAMRRLCWTIFLLTIGLLICHGLLERLLGLKEGTMALATALIMGAITLFLSGTRARHLVEKRVDWWTLAFFMMLFASVGTLEQTGVTRVLAGRIISGAGDNPAAVIQIVGWSTGWLSAFLDNVLAVATFLPIVHDIRTHAASGQIPAPYPAAIYWLMLFGGTFMGNMTTIGSTANIVAIGILENRGHGTIRFMQWFKIGLIVAIATMLLASALLAMQTHNFTQPTLPPP